MDKEIQQGNQDDDARGPHKKMETGTYKVDYINNQVGIFTRQVFWPRDNECSISAQGQISTVAIFTVSDIQGAFIILLVTGPSLGKAVQCTVQCCVQCTVML